MVPAHQGEEARIRLAYARRQTDPRYSWFSRSHLLFMQERERYALAALKREGLLSLESKRILEIGCGTGHWLREFVKWGALPEHITGVDLLPDKVATARKLCPEQVAILCGNATRLALPDEAFDLVFQSTVFTSMLDADMKRQVASEMRRVVKRDGLILWYDFFADNPWNAEVRGIRKREIHQLFPDCRVELRRITLAPPLLRFLAPYSWLACYVLGRIPWLCTHYLGIIHRRL
jgi:ubiquinone/menaquinone biosynthesis C-methylase UbiE